LKENAYLVPIREKIKVYTGKTYSVGTIYAPLNRLSLNGYLEESIGEPNAVRGGKAIKFYQLTEKGLQALIHFKETHKRMWDGFIHPALEK